MANEFNILDFDAQSVRRGFVTDAYPTLLGPDTVSEQWHIQFIEAIVPIKINFRPPKG